MNRYYFNENNLNIPYHEELKVQLEQADLDLVEQAFDAVKNNKRRREMLEGLVPELFDIDRDELHEWCTEMLAYAKPSKASLKLGQQVEDNIIAWERERLKRLQKELVTLKEQNKLDEAIETGRKLLKQSIDLKGKTHLQTLKIRFDLARISRKKELSKKASSRKSNPNNTYPKNIFAIQNLISRLATQLFAALNLASLFGQTIEWIPTIENLIHLYQKLIHPLWGLVFWWIDTELSSFFKDLLTLNFLLMTVLISSRIMVFKSKSGRSPIASIAFSELNRVVGHFRNLFRGKNPLHKIGNILLSTMRAIITIWAGLMVISITIIAYGYTIINLLRKIVLSKSVEEKKDSFVNLRKLIWSTVTIFFGFFILLGINYMFKGPFSS